MTESKQKRNDKQSTTRDLLDKIRSSANYCFNCNRCVNVCPQSKSKLFTPRSLITDLALLSLEEAIEYTNIWHCLTCGRCMEYCPMSKDNVGVNIPNIILNLRSISSEYDLLQERKVECRHGRDYTNLPKLMAEDKIKFENKIGFLENSNLKISSKGEIAYFMGCLPLLNGIAPCSKACPAGVDVQGYVSLIKDGKFQEAIDLIREKNPFPVVCGRICTHPCEESCNRIDIDESIAIRALKRFISDWEIQNKGNSRIKPVKQDKEKVAIIGAGPAGLTAAYYLALNGYKPTVFEASAHKGGKLRTGIPKYRLPPKILDYEIEFIEKMGVEIKTSTPIGPDLTFDTLREQGYKAFFITIGLENSREMKIEGENLKNVFYGLNFLEEHNLGTKKYNFKGKIVGVTGGGNVAIDSARTALRLGAKKVVVIYRRSENEMPALGEEIEAAKEEGIEFQFLTNPFQIVSDDKGSCSEVECISMELGEPDDSGRRRPVEIEGSAFRIKIDVLILAIGQVPDYSLIKTAQDKFKCDKWGNITFDDLTLETSIPGVFIGGDVLGGKGVAITAISNGYEAAISIDRYLKGLDLKEGRVKRENYKSSPFPKKEVKSIERNEMDELSVEERVKSFKEIELGFDEETAIKEASRCLKCSSCNSCDQSSDVKLQTCAYGENPVNTTQNTLDYLKIPKAVIGLLNQKEIEPVVLKDEKCCGHDSLWQGDLETFEKLAKYNVKLFKDAGVNTLIFSCAEGYYTWKHQYKELFDDSNDFDFEIYHISEFIVKENLLDELTFPVMDKIKVTYHDPCRLGRMSKVYDAPREIFKKLSFIELVEMENNKQDATCCGISAYIACNINSKLLQSERIKEAINTGAEYLITSCPKCLAHFNCYLDEHQELKNQIKIVDLTSFLGNLLFLV